MPFHIILLPLYRGKAFTVGEKCGAIQYRFSHAHAVSVESLMQVEEFEEEVLSQASGEKMADDEGQGETNIFLISFLVHIAHRHCGIHSLASVVHSSGGL